MTRRHIALLRGINVGGNKLVAMAALRDLAAKLGLEDPRTLLQSGNLVFRSAGRTTAQLERLLATEIRERLGVESEILVRTAAQWTQVIDGNPFREEAVRDPGHLLVMFLKQAPEVAAVQKLQEAISGREVVRARGSELYLVYPDGVGRSKLTNLLIEKSLGTRGTARNWNTVRKLGDMVADDQA